MSDTGETSAIDVKIQLEEEEESSSPQSDVNTSITSKVNEIKNPNEANLFDINDQNELDYEDELDENLRHLKEAAVNSVESIQKQNDEEEDSDGEVKSSKNSDDELDDGEVSSPKATLEKHSSNRTKHHEEKNLEKEVEVEEIVEDEEDGEINDGEKVKKAFIPRVLCKYYQRGKCTWGRTCKFLHPGVNDTGNYSFLEFQDPNAKLFQYSAAGDQSSEEKANGSNNRPDQSSSEPIQTESAWERGLRHAKEMKEKALRRKQMEKEQFDDKKMNLSLKEFENEKENDERYVNIEAMPTADDDLEDEELNQFAKSGRIQKNSHMDQSDDRSQQYGSKYSQSKLSSNQKNRSIDSQNDLINARKQNDSKFRQTEKTTKQTGRKTSSSPSARGGHIRQQKADEWHDPWDRPRQSKRGQQYKDDKSNSYSSSDSDSRSRSKSRSRSVSKSSYSSRSSYSYRSSSSRSGSRSPTRSKTKGQNLDRQSRPLQRNAGDTSKTSSGKLSSKQTGTNVEKSKKPEVTAAKPLPGRQISDFSLKKAGLDTIDKNKKATKKKASRSKSNSSASSYDSSNSKSNDDDDDDDFSNDSDSYSDDDDDEIEEKSKKSKKKSMSIKKSADTLGKNPLKRSAQDSVKNLDAKKTKLSGPSSGTASSDKKQMIKDQLKLLESALKKKSMSK